MNPELLAALRTQAECRQAWNALAEDAAADEIRAAREALEAADQAVIEALETAESSEGAPAELRDRVSLGRYMDGIVHERVADGAEAELRQELRLGDNQVPLEALLPLPEERADTVSPQNAAGDGPLAFDAVFTTTGPMLRRLFSATDTAFLGVGMPTVPAGERVYPVMTQGTGASMQARGGKPDAGGARFDVVNATPHRLTGRYVFDLEGVATLGSMLESTLRSDLRMELGYQLDRQVLLGTGAGAQVKGLLASLAGEPTPGVTIPSSGSGPADLSAVMTWALAKQMATGSLDGKLRRMESDLRFLIGGDTYDLLRTLYRSSQAESRDAIEEVRNLGSSVRRSFQIAAAAVLPAGTGTSGAKVGTKKVQSALMSAEPRAAVAPVWQGITMIRDPYTEAGEGRIQLTAHMLFDFVMRRTDGWEHYWIRTEA